ncbi:heavy metal-responsive transcriptional regulator [Arthrobacter sp. SO3]|uniref:heavy metal-responsive transcriptional regulator n=1 Tax=Arthrobacter sp. SO3 TaxID=1897057 RepID=UPI001CFFDE56|nr:heavy metal-responsive transcriptional regulator [Arthrobacter sp. SO3]MCB5292539.1 Mercuric resistance operon regulatory protein [Arthrobacter sp. SO3]
MLIGSAAAAAGVSTKAVRFYEEQGLLPAPERAANGYRIYAPDTVGRLDFIRRGRAAGLSVSQLRDILAVRDPGNAPCPHVRDALADQLAALDAQIAELTALRNGMAEAHAAVAAGDPATCDAGLICSYL